MLWCRVTVHPSTYEIQKARRGRYGLSGFQGELDSQLVPSGNAAENSLTLAPTHSVHLLAASLRFSGVSYVRAVPSIQQRPYAVDGAQERGRHEQDGSIACRVPPWPSVPLNSNLFSTLSHCPTRAAVSKISNRCDEEGIC